MGLLIHPELTLDCGLSTGSWIPKTIGEFLDEVAAIESVSAKILKLEDYVSRLQEEMKKIDVFRRELPLSVLLISDAIATVVEELQRCKKLKMEPILEEFMPTKKISKEEEEKQLDLIEEKENTNTSNRDKMNWMSSVQLWNSDSSPTQTLDPKIKKRKEDESSSIPMDDLFLNGQNRAAVRAFTPSPKGCSNFGVMMFGKEVREEDPGSGSRLPLPIPSLPLTLCPPEIKNEATTNPPPPAFSSKSTSIRSSLSSSATTNNTQSNSSQQTARKQRRCWSPELHRRFVTALQQLGGAQAATPKQIRELMQVDGLTNDEVKSHLQKYRLHIRKVPRAATSTPTTEPTLMGGLWVCGESSGSPQDHLPGRGGGGSSSDSMMEDEDEDDGKSRES